MSSKKKEKNMLPAVIPVATEVFNAKQVKALELAKECVALGSQMGEKFRDLIQFCRANLTPKEIPPVMIAAGFPASRASEFKQIALLPDSDYELYQTKQIGWRPALELAREKRQKSGRTRQRDLMAPVMKAVRRQLYKHPNADKCMAAYEPTSASPNGSFVLVLAGKNEQGTFNVAGRIIEWINRAA